MGPYIAKRLGHLVLVAVGVSVVIFLLVHLAPGDPIMVLLGERATPEQLARTREAYGLDQPLHVQYWRFVTNAATGRFETSIRHGVPSGHLVAERIPRTLLLIATSSVIATAFGLVFGIISAVRRETSLDYVVSVISFIGISAPSFWMGIMFMLIFAVRLGWFPVLSSWVNLSVVWSSAVQGNLTPFVSLLKALTLPAITNSLWMMALIMRMTRTSCLEEMNRDYIRTALSKGLHERRVYFGHMLRNAMLPVVTVVGIQFGTVISGAVITETVFSWPGMGLLLVDSVFQRDYPVVQTIVVITAIMFALLNLLVDLSYAVLDPRIRYR